MIVGRITACNKHFCLGIDFKKRLHAFIPAHPGHVQIQNDKVDFREIVLVNVQGAFAVFRAENLVSVIFKHLLCHFTDRLLVVYNQDALFSALEYG